jgi:hypothetical protein
MMCGSSWAHHFLLFVSVTDRWVPRFFFKGVFGWRDIPKWETGDSVFECVWLVGEGG